MNPGRMDKRVTFLRRPAKAADGAGNTRGSTWDEVLTVWAEFRQLTGREAPEAGRLVDQIDGVLVIRDSAAARQVTAADRARVMGQDFAITSVALPERRAGTILVSIARKSG